MDELYWVVPADTWPTFDIDRDQFLEMMDKFDEYYGYAVASLADSYPPEAE